MNGYLLDTHVWLWITRRAQAEVSAGFFREVENWQREGIAFLSPVSAWEIGLLVASKQLELDLPIDRLWERDTGDHGLRIVPLTARILIESTRLPGEVHRDPADRMLIATAREHGLTLVTRDKNLLRYAKEGHLKARKP